MIRSAEIAAFALASCAAVAPLAAHAQSGMQAGPRAGEAACPVEGVWDLVSMSANGREEPLSGYRQRKILARGHYMWVGQEAKRDTLPLKTATDSLLASRMLGGAGTYTTTDTTYTEQLEFFFHPAYVGKSLTATCRVEGDRWYHSFTDAFGSQPAERRVEVWRRVK